MIPSDHVRWAARVLTIGVSGPTLSAAEAARLERLRPGGAVLFARNLENPAQTRDLTDRLAERLASSPWIAVDQEGGRVSRLSPWIGPTAVAAEWAERGEAATRRFGADTGRTLADLGFNLDFAPVVDLSPPDAPNGIGDRAFSRDPEETVRRAGAFLDGLQSAGVAGSLKHFPGLGETVVDSHLELPRVSADRAALERGLEPFRRLGPRAATVMVGHAHYEAIEPTPTPATLSRAIVDGLLRGRCGFGGPIVSDDMEMGAVADRDADGAATVLAIEAGCDMILYCSDLDRAERAHDALVVRAETDPAFRERLREAARAVELGAKRWPRRSTPAPPDAARLAERFADHRPREA